MLSLLIVPFFLSALDAPSWSEVYDALDHGTPRERREARAWAVEHADEEQLDELYRLQAAHPYDPDCAHAFLSVASRVDLATLEALYDGHLLARPRFEHVTVAADGWMWRSKGRELEKLAVALRMRFERAPYRFLRGSPHALPRLGMVREHAARIAVLRSMRAHRMHPRTFDDLAAVFRASKHVEVRVLIAEVLAKSQLRWGGLACGTCMTPETIRRLAARADQRRVTFLLEVGLKDASPRVRMVAIRGLSRCSRLNAYEAIHWMFDDPDQRVRATAKLAVLRPHDRAPHRK